MTTPLHVARVLFRLYRPVLLWTFGLLAVGDAIGMTVITRVTDPPFSLWVMIVSQAAKYWLLVVGIILVSMYLRQFVANGVTRRDFFAGGGLFGLGMAALWSLLVPLGHGIENVVLATVGTPPGYPRLTLGLAADEFGHSLPSAVAYLVSGVVITAGFYRYGGLGGLWFLIPGMLPLAVAEGLLALGEQGQAVVRSLPYAGALAVTLATAAVLAAVGRHLLRDVPIRSATT